VITDPDVPFAKRAMARHLRTAGAAFAEYGLPFSEYEVTAQDSDAGYIQFTRTCNGAVVEMNGLEEDGTSPQYFIDLGRGATAREYRS
jgi:hypothetical protein